MSTLATALKSLHLLLRHSRYFGMGVALTSAFIVVAGGLVAQATAEVRAQAEATSIMRTIEVRSGGQDEPLPLTEARIDELASIPGVTEVRPWVRVGTLIVEADVAAADAGKAGALWATPYMGVGQPPVIHAERQQLVPLHDDEAILPARAQGESMVPLLGERVVVEYTQRTSVDTGEARHVELHVVGLYDEAVDGRDGPAAMYVSESAAVEMAAAAEGIQSDDFYSGLGFPRVIVAVEAAAAVPDAQRRISELGYAAANAQSLVDRLPAAMRLLDLLARVLTGALLLSCVIAGLTIGAGLIRSRWRDIGRRKAVGATNGRIARLLGVELGLFGLLAGAAGVGFGLAVSTGLQLWLGGGNLFGAQLAAGIFSPAVWVLVGLALAPSAAMLIGALLPLARVSVVPAEEAIRTSAG